MKRNRTILLGAAALLALIAFVAPHPRADIRILTHRAGDLAPQKAQAVVDVGLASISVLITWSKRLGY
jgi:precorrin-6B methylase 2